MRSRSTCLWPRKLSTSACAPGGRHGLVRLASCRDRRAPLRRDGSSRPRLRDEPAARLPLRGHGLRGHGRRHHRHTQPEQPADAVMRPNSGCGDAVATVRPGPFLQHVALGTLRALHSIAVWRRRGRGRRGLLREGEGAVRYDREDREGREKRELPFHRPASLGRESRRDYHDANPGPSGYASSGIRERRDVGEALSGAGALQRGSRSDRVGSAPCRETRTGPRSPGSCVGPPPG